MIDFRKYGIDNFNFEIIDEAEKYEEVIQKEHNWIVKENCVMPNGYNQTKQTDSPMFDPVVAKKMSDTKRIKYGKKVCEINENNQILQIWNSIAEAGEKTGLNRYKISSVCNGERLTTGNRVFRFIDENNQIIEPNVNKEKPINNRIIKTSRKVNAYDLEGNFIQSFDSLQLAAQFCNGSSSTIGKVCKGERNKHKNYIWRYADE